MLWKRAKEEKVQSEKEIIQFLTSIQRNIKTLQKKKEGYHTSNRDRTIQWKNLNLRWSDGKVLGRRQ